MEPMESVWVAFRSMEMCCAMIALAFHIAAIYNPDHPMEHVMHLCGTFCGFALLGLFMNVGVALNQRIPIVYEVIFAVFGFLLFIFAAFSTMYLAERDEDLKFLVEDEERLLPNFYYCKGQFLSIVCMAIHIDGFLYLEEPFKHIVFFCGTFFGFAVIDILLNIGYCMGVILPVFLEALIACTAFVLFITSSILSLYYAENDLHLEYLSDDEEVLHVFFYNSRRQSIASLLGGVIYLLHAVFAIDYLITAARHSKTRRITTIFNDPGNIEDGEIPFHLHFFCSPLFKISMCCSTCRNNSQQSSADETVEM